MANVYTVTAVRSYTPAAAATYYWVYTVPAGKVFIVRTIIHERAGGSASNLGIRWRSGGSGLGARLLSVSPANDISAVVDLRFALAAGEELGFYATTAGNCIVSVTGWLLDA